MEFYAGLTEFSSGECDRFFCVPFSIKIIKFVLLIACLTALPYQKDGEGDVRQKFRKQPLKRYHGPVFTFVGVA